jgi:hypothetical protein
MLHPSILSLVTFPAMLLAVSPSHASTPGAWQTLFAAAGQRCLVASGLLEAKASAQPADFNDEVVILVTGMWPQPHMKRAAAQMLCRYNKANGQVQVIELPPDWRAQLQQN